MKKLRLHVLIIYSLAACSGAMLLYTSQKVQDAETRLDQVHAKIAMEENAIRVLNAEWAYLNSPPRLEALASQYLDLEFPQSHAVISKKAAEVLLKERSDLSDSAVLLRHVASDGVVPPSFSGEPLPVSVRPPPRKPDAQNIIGRKPEREEKKFDKLLKSLAHSSDSGGAP